MGRKKRPRIWPEWGLDVDKRIKRLGIFKKQFANDLGLNYQTMNNVLSGYLNREDVKEVILNRLEELEKTKGAKK